MIEAFSPVGRYRILAGLPSSAHVEYEVTARYSVAGTEHRVKFHLVATPSETVELRYNPRDPGEFVVGTQSRWGSILLLAMSFLFLLEGLTAE